VLKRHRGGGQGGGQGGGEDEEEEEVGGKRRRVEEWVRGVKGGNVGSGKGQQQVPPPPLPGVLEECVETARLLAEIGTLMEEISDTLLSLGSFFLAQ
jgi:hypothetical protein